MKLTKNENLYTLKDKIKDLDPSTLTTLGQTDYDAIDILSSRMTGVFDGASDDGWHDKVRTGITTGMTTLKSYFDEEKKSAEFIKGAVTPITNMKSIVLQYVDEFDKYAAIADKKPTMYEQENGQDKIYEDGRKRVSQEYLSWSKSVDAYETAIPKLEAEAERLVKAVKNYFAAIDLTTHTIDSSVYAEGDGDIKIDYTQILAQIKDIPDDQYVKKHDTEFTTDDEGHIVSKDEYEVHVEFEDGSKYDGEKTVEQTYNDINGDGKIDETDELIYTKVHEEGTYTDTEGNEYGYLHDEESDQIGLVHSHTVVTDKDTNEVVGEEETDRVAAYPDTTTGSEVTEVNETVNDGETTTETRTTTNAAPDGRVFTHETNVTRQNDDPQCGFTAGDDGTGWIVSRNDEGKLVMQRCTVVDGVATPQEGRRPRPVEETTRTLTVTYPDGSTETRQINPNNPLDWQVMDNMLVDARTMSGEGNNIQADPTFKTLDTLKQGKDVEWKGATFTWSD